MAARGSKSKKRSGASSKSKPPEPVVFFLDRSLGKRIVAEALRQAGVKVEVHDDHFTQNAQDEDWLPVVGAKGWIVLTRDKRIRYRTPALIAVGEAKVRLFAYTGTDVQGVEMAQSILVALPAIKRLLLKHEPPFIAKISRGGTVGIWVSHRDLRRVGGY
jgi:hypothetical protein